MTIRAFREGEPVGGLEYFPAETPGGPITLEGVNCDPAEPYLGRKLLRRFVETVGPNKLIVGYIANDSTKRYLLRSGFMEGVDEQSPKDITELIDLEKIPLTRVLRTGNLNLTRLRIVYSAEVLEADPEFPYAIHFEAVTK
ncbi:hypothetical protein HYS91_05305 [Candidatus Daviesbacteria bacterium]|nr:hypothetical protein [Candidatus Daviesbacteria bacterium]